MLKSRGVIRKSMAWMLSAFCLVFSSGCTATFSLEADKLMEPPVISTEQQKIEVILNKVIPDGYSYKYPKSGDVQDAIVIKDFDQDELREALVFVKEDVSPTNAHIIVLKENEEKEWTFLQDIEGTSAEIDQVLLEQLEDEEYNVVIGYSAYSNTKRMNIYRWEDAGLNEVVSDVSYLYFGAAPSAQGDYNDLIVVSKEYDEGSTIEQARLSVYSSTGSLGAIERTSYVPLGVDIPQVTKIYSEFLPETKQTLLYLDLTITPGQDMFTEAYLYDSFTLTQVLTDDQQPLRRVTGRTKQSTKDIDGDGHYEVQTRIDASRTATIKDVQTEEILQTAYWGAVQNGVFEVKVSTIYNSASNYLYTIPNEWVGLITVSLSDNKEEMLIKNADGSANYLSILAVPKEELTDNRKEEIKTSGYELILSEEETSETVYYKRIYSTDSTGDAGSVILYGSFEDDPIKL